MSNTMDRLVNVDMKWLGRLLRTTDNEYKFRFEVSETDTYTGPWERVNVPVEFNSGSNKWEDIPGTIYRPLTSDGTAPNNDVYEKVISGSNTDYISKDNLIEIRIPRNMRYYRIVTSCPRCERLFPIEQYRERYTSDTGEFIIASGPIKNIN